MSDEEAEKEEMKDEAHDVEDQEQEEEEEKREEEQWDTKLWSFVKLRDRDPQEYYESNRKGNRGGQGAGQTFCRFLSATGKSKNLCLDSG